MQGVEDELPLNTSLMYGFKPFSVSLFLSLLLLFFSSPPSLLLLSLPVCGKLFISQCLCSSWPKCFKAISVNVKNTVSPCCIFTALKWERRGGKMTWESADPVIMDKHLAPFPRRGYSGHSPISTSPSDGECWLSRPLLCVRHCLTAGREANASVCVWWCLSSMMLHRAAATTTHSCHPRSLAPYNPTITPKVCTSPPQADQAPPSPGLRSPQPSSTHTDEKQTQPCQPS